jgi:hypothetical protein
MGWNNRETTKETKQKLTGGTMNTEVIYQDGSMSTFQDSGALHNGGLAIERIRLITAKSALTIYIKYQGKMELTRNGARNAIQNVIEPLTGKTYKRSMKGKQEALDDCIELLDFLERNAVRYTDGD